MTHIITTFCAAILLLSSSLASACPNVSKRSKAQNSDIIVDGKATCDVRLGKCEFERRQVVKGLRALGKASKPLIIQVPEYNPDSDGFSCGIAWTPYENGVYEGRFYLNVNSKKSLSASYWPDAWKVQ